MKTGERDALGRRLLAGVLISLKATMSNPGHRVFAGETLELRDMSGRFIEGAWGAIDASLDALARIILMARLFEANAEASIQGQGRHGASGVDAPASLTSTGADLKSAIDSLSSDDQAILVALAWIGRGDFSPAEFDRAVVMAFERQAAGTAGYLMGLPLLGDLLELGAAACGAELSGVSPGGSSSVGSIRH
jgi:hypothetical protein